MKNTILFIIIIFTNFLVLETKAQSDLLALPNNSVMDFSDCAGVPYSTTPLPIPSPSITNPLSDAELYSAWIQITVFLKQVTKDSFQNFAAK